MRPVVLITTGQPSVNPRIVKEADALHAAGFDVMVLYCFWIGWASQADKTLLKTVDWKSKLIGGSPTESRWLYYFTKARCKISKLLNRKGYNQSIIAERSQARCYDELLKAAVEIKADVYIGHNLGALAVAVNAARHNEAKAGFDFEDYHRAENEDETRATKTRIIYLEQKYIPFLGYISASSKLIAEKVRDDSPTFKGPIISLLNSFPLSQRSSEIIETEHDKSLRLFWFSQTVGRNRGLESVVTALVKLNNPHIQLTLAGRVDGSFLHFLDESAASIRDRVHLPGIIQPENLPAFAAKFDVGLATEMANPLNRNICLTNKIFIYLLAGNCILASDTLAQEQFLDTYKNIGILYRNNDIDDLASRIDFLFNHSTFLDNCKAKSFELATAEMNWEIESKKLLHTVSSIM